MQVLRAAVNVRAGIQNQTLTGEGWERNREGRALDAPDSPEAEEGGRHRRPGIAGAHESLSGAVLDQANGNVHRRVRTATDGLDWVLGHVDDVGGVDNLDRQPRCNGKADELTAVEREWEWITQRQRLLPEQQSPRRDVTGTFWETDRST